MKKFIAIAALLVILPVSAFAGTSAQTSGDDFTTSSVNFDKYPRVLTFGEARNASAADGTLLVCPQTAEANWRETTCTGNGKNAWVSAESILPGWVLKRYEFRFTGSGGYRHLILYFSKK